MGVGSVVGAGVAVATVASGKGVAVEGGMVGTVGLLYPDLHYTYALRHQTCRLERVGQRMHVI